MSLHGFTPCLLFAAKQRIAVYLDKVAPGVPRGYSKTNIHLGGYNGCC